MNEELRKEIITASIISIIFICIVALILVYVPLKEIPTKTIFDTNAALRQEMENAKSKCVSLCNVYINDIDESKSCLSDLYVFNSNGWACGFDSCDKNKTIVLNNKCDFVKTIYLLEDTNSPITNN